MNVLSTPHQMYELRFIWHNGEACGGRSMGFSYKQKREIILDLRKLRRVRRQINERLTFNDVEELIWNLPPSFFTRLNERISNWQRKKKG
jgi:hypothetical protein